MTGVPPRTRPLASPLRPCEGNSISVSSVLGRENSAGARLPCAVRTILDHQHRCPKRCCKECCAARKAGGSHILPCRAGVVVRPQGAHGSRAPGLGRAGARVRVQLRLRAGLCRWAVGRAATLGAAGRVTRGWAPPRRRDHVGAGARSSRGAVPRGQVLRGGRHRPAGTARAGPLCRTVFPPHAPASSRARSAGPQAGAAGHAGQPRAAGRASRAPTRRGRRPSILRGPAERIPCQGGLSSRPLIFP